MSYFPLQESEIPTNASNLITTFLSKATWIWPTEDSSLTPPLVPAGAQRAFRLTWTNPSTTSQIPSSTTIIITADNSFELFVNGILLHAGVAGNVDTWYTPLMFKVPLAGGPQVTYAVRAVNEHNANDPDDNSPNAAGLRAAIQMDFTSSTSPVILDTVVGEGWRSSHVFGNGWEQPGFDDGDWELAKAMPTTWGNTAVAVWDQCSPCLSLGITIKRRSTTRGAIGIAHKSNLVCCPCQGFRFPLLPLTAPGMPCSREERTMSMDGPTRESTLRSKLCSESYTHSPA